MQQHKLPAELTPAAAAAWYRQPVLWLGAAIFAASLAGCIWTIVLGSRYADLPVDDGHRHALLDMPVHEQNAERGAGQAQPSSHAPLPHEPAQAPGRGP